MDNGDVDVAAARPNPWTRRLVTLVVAAMLLVAGSLYTVDTASADGIHHVYNTQGDGLWLHPESPTLQSEVSDLLPDGAEFDIWCWSYGDSVNGDSIWEFGTYDANGDNGYAADYYIDTQVTEGDEAPQLTAQGIVQCGSGVPPATTTSGWISYCGGNDYAAQVQVQNYSLGQFEIQVTPTSNARYAQLSGYGTIATNEIWHAVQDCVSGLEATLADGIYEQIRCHILGGLSGPLDAGGQTYDFESWRLPVDWSVAIATECNWGGWPYVQVGLPFRPDELSNQPTF